MIQLQRAFQTIATLLVSKENNIAKGLCVAVVLGFILTFSSQAFNALSVQAVTIFPPRFHVWTILTAPFLERSIILLCVDLFAISFLSKIVKPLWGSVEFLIFFEIINLSTILLGSFFYIFVYAVSSNEYFLFEASIHGMSAYVAGITVVIKQIMPDHVVFRLPIASRSLKFRNRNLPLASVLLYCTLSVIGVLQPECSVMSVIGFLTAFIYLRFFQKHSNIGQGDMSETFAFATFFPVFLQPVVSVFSNSVFNILVRLNVCQKPINRYTISPSDGLSTTTGPVLPKSFDEERRKVLAKKALSERMEPKNADNNNNPGIGESFVAAAANIPDASDNVSQAEVKPEDVV